MNASHTLYSRIPSLTLHISWSTVYPIKIIPKRSLQRELKLDLTLLLAKGVSFFLHLCYTGWLWWSISYSRTGWRKTLDDSGHCFLGAQLWRIQTRSLYKCQTLSGLDWETYPGCCSLSWRGIYRSQSWSRYLTPVFDVCGFKFIIIFHFMFVSSWHHNMIEYCFDSQNRILLK